MALRTSPHDRSDDAGHERLAAQLFEREGTVCYSLAVHLLGTPSVAARLVGQVLGDAVGSPATWTRVRLLDEVHRHAVAQIRDRPRRLDPARAETRAWNGLDDPPVRAVLTDMPALPRSVVLLIYFAGYRLRELADALERTPDELRGALRIATTILARDPRTGRTH